MRDFTFNSQTAENEQYSHNLLGVLDREQALCNCTLPVLKFPAIPSRIIIKVECIMKITMNTEYSLSWLDRELQIIRKCWSPLVILYKHSHYNSVYSNAFFHLLPIAWFLRWNGESSEIWCGSSVDPEYTNISFQESGSILGHDFIIIKITLAKSQHWWSCKCKSECSKSQW